jgi:hypothetical protein
MIPFKKYYRYCLEEAKEGDRTGIQHLYSYNKPELYSMSFENFKKFIEYLKQNGNKIDPSNSSVSEKVDGMALKVGNDELGNFFVQSSYSGKVYKSQDFLQVIKFPPAQQAFINSFDRLREMIRPIIGETPCEIQIEWLYSPNATKLEDRPGMVSFVTSGYQESKLGTWSTFVILKVSCKDLDPNEVKSKLLSLTNEEVKFMLPDVEVFTPIDLSSEAKKAQTIILEIENQQLPQQILELKGNRKRDAIQKRKELEKTLSSLLLPIQKEMYEKIVSNLTKTEGILGDIEGYVVKAGDLMFKVNNPEFMKTKFGV